MDDLHVWPATTRILDLSARPRPDSDAIRDTLNAFDTRAAQVTLTVATAQAIAERLQHAPLAIRLQSAAEHVAYTLIRLAHEEPQTDLPTVVEDLTTAQLAQATLVLLDIWTHTARVDADRTLRGRHTGEIPIVTTLGTLKRHPAAAGARLSAVGDEKTPGGTPAPVRAAGGPTLPVATIRAALRAGIER